MPGPAQNPPPPTRPPAEAPSHSPQPSTSFTPLSSQSRPQRSTRLPARYRDETNTNSGPSQVQPPSQGTTPHPPVQPAFPLVPLPLPHTPLQLQPQAAAPPPLAIPAATPAVADPDDGAASQGTQPNLPIPDFLPTLEEAHQTHIPTHKWPPKQ